MAIDDKLDNDSQNLESKVESPVPLPFLSIPTYLAGLGAGGYYGAKIGYLGAATAGMGNVLPYVAMGAGALGGALTGVLAGVMALTPLYLLTKKGRAFFKTKKMPEKESYSPQMPMPQMG